MLAVTRRTRDKPVGSPKIDRNHPLGKQMQFAVLGNAGGSLLIDAIGGLPLTANQGAAFGTGGAIYGPKCNAAGKGFQCLAPAYLRPTSAVTLFWRGWFLGTPDINTYMIIGTYDNAGTTPFATYGVYYDGNGAIATLTNVSGSFVSMASTTPGVPPLGRMVDFAMTYDGGTLTLWRDGLKDKSQATSGAITYGATAQITIGQDTAASTHNPQHVTDCAYMFPNVALNGGQIFDLHNDPYGMWAQPSKIWFNSVVTSGSGLRFNASLSGLGASGPFFHDRLAS